MGVVVGALLDRFYAELNPTAQLPPPVTSKTSGLVAPPKVVLNAACDEQHEPAAEPRPMGTEQHEPCFLRLVCALGRDERLGRDAPIGR